MNKSSNDSTEKEVDLLYLIKKIGDLFDRIGYFFYKLFLFSKRNIITLLLLLVLGIGGGYLLDSFSKNTYRHEVIVVPNFNSTPYLYDYINGHSFKDFSVKKASIEPIVNVYDLIKERYQNLEAIKQFSLSNIAFAKYEEGLGVEQFYRYHLLTIYTDEVENADVIIDKLLSTLNQDSYFLQRQKVELDNTDKLIRELNLSIEHINNLLDKFGTQETKSAEVNIDNYSELNELVNVKKNSMDELNRQKIIRIEQAKVIYDASRITNIKEIKLQFKYLLPLLLIFGFFGIVFLKKLFKRYESYKDANA